MENKMARRLASRISEKHQGIPVLITGDITDSGTSCQCRKARSILKNLSKTNPVLLVPGNHDYNWFGFIGKHEANRNWERYLSSQLGWNRDINTWLSPENEPSGISGVGTWKYGDIIFIGIDTGDPNDQASTAQGYVSEVQRNAISKVLQTNSVNRTRIVLLHHHPFQRTIGLKLKGADELMRVLSGNCEMVLFGHRHRYEQWTNYKNIPYIISSHKSTAEQYGGRLEFILITINDPGTPAVMIRHRLERIDFS